MVNMNRKNIVEPMLHVLVVVILFGFPYTFTGSQDSVDWKMLVNRSIVPIAMCVVFYADYFLLVPKLLFRGKTLLCLNINVLLVLVVGLSMRLWQWFVFPGDQMPGPPPGPGMMPVEGLRPDMEISFFIRDVTLLALVAGLAVAICYGKRWLQAENMLKEAERLRIEAERGRMEAELMNMRNQLNPHFLLNTLNCIYSLIGFDKDKARTAVSDLSRLLRYVLYEVRQDMVPLRKEVDFILDYIALMKMRFGANVNVETRMDISEDSRTEIAPLLFISLIENAFKHGVNPSEDSVVKISITEDDTSICCKTVNSYNPDKHSDSVSGIGLEQLAKRLDILYKGRYEWIYGPDEEKQFYRSVLTIFKHGVMSNPSGGSGAPGILSSPAGQM